MRRETSLLAPFPLLASTLTNRLALLAVIVVAFAVHLHAIEQPGIWYDEAYSLLLARETPARIWALTALDVHPPLYYVLLHYWCMLWGESALPARLLSVLANIGTLLLCMKLLSLIATRRAMWIAAWMLALLPISVRYSQEARMYALLGFWLMGATVALVCWLRVPDKKRYALMYVLLMAAALYTHYFSVFCVMTHWLYWWRSCCFQRKLKAHIRPWILVNGAIVFLFLPWLPRLFDQVASKPYFGWIPPTTWHSVLDLMGEMTVDTHSTALQIGVCAFIGACAYTVCAKDRNEQQYSWLLVGYFFLPFMLLVMLSLLKPVLWIRYFYFAAMGLPLIVAVALDSWWQQKRIVTILLLTLCFFGEIHGVKETFRSTDNWSRLGTLANNMNAHVRSDDTIVFDNLFWYLPFALHNKTGVLPTIYVGRDADRIWGFPGRSGWALLPPPVQSGLLDDDSVLSLNAGRLWWITQKDKPVDVSSFSDQWKKVQTLDGGDVEARLYIRSPRPAQ